MATRKPPDGEYLGGIRLKTEAEMRKARADARTEAPIEGHFIKVAKLYGCLQRKLTQFYAEDGWPDRLCVWPDGRGTTDWLELKRPKGGKLEPRQKVILPELQARGAHVRVLSTREMVDDWFLRRAQELGVPVPKVRRKPSSSAKLLEMPMPPEVARAANALFKRPVSGRVGKCSICGYAVRNTPSGTVCVNGHGGAEVV